MPAWYFQPVRDTRWSEPDTEIVAGPVTPANPFDSTLFDGMRTVVYVNVNLEQPVTYQWLKGGVEISGATMPYYLFRATAADNNAQYSVRVTSKGGTPLTVGAAPLVVNTDMQRPTVVSAGTAPQNPTVVQVVYSEEVNETTATNLANYTLPGATLESARVLSDGKTVQIRTGLLTPDMAWVLTVRNVTDWASIPNTIDPSPTVITLLPADGAITFRTYGNYATDLATLRTWSNTNSTAATYTNSQFDSEQSITTSSPGWNLTPLRDNFVGQWIGYVTAPETGNYIFAVASDDHSILYLGTNHLRASKREIANYNGSTGRWNLGAQANQRSAPIRLEAGKRYYIEAVFRDGSGGDGVTVAWQRPSDAAMPSANESIQANTEPFYINATNLTPYYAFAPVTLRSNLTATLSAAESTRPTLRVAAEGVTPYTYTWYGNGTVITNAKTSSYQLPFLTSAFNNSVYYVVVNNNFSSVTSAVTTLTVTADTTKPTIASAGSLLKQQVDVRFSEPVTAATASNVGSYSLFTSGGSQVAINTVLVDANDPTHVTLQTAPMPDTEMLRLVINGIADSSTAGNVSAAITNTFRANNFDAAIRIGNAQDWAASANGDQMRLTAGGSDIWGTSDQMTYVYKTVSGNFDYKLQAPSALPAVNQWVKMGLMARSTTLGGSRNVFIAWTPPSPAQNTYTPQVRDATGGLSTSSADVGSPLNIGMEIGITQRPTVAYPSWLRLQRIGDTFYLYYGTTGTNWTLWTSYDSMNGPGGEGAMPRDLLLGIALTSHDTARTAEGIASGFQAIPAVALSLVLQPTNTTVVEGQTASLSASVTGNSPYRYQWLKNGEPISEATNTSLALPRVAYSDHAALIAIRVTNPLGESRTSTNAVLTVIKDVTAPTVRYMFAPKVGVVQNEVKLLFSEPMNRQSAETPANYSVTPISGGSALNISSAMLDADERTVTLATGNMTPGTTYRVVVNNVADLACCPANVIAANSTDFFYFAGSSGKFTQRTDGYIIMEAESAQRNVPATGAAWELQNDPAFGPWSGIGYMNVPTVGGTGGGITTVVDGKAQGTGSYIEFDVNFTLPTTNYTVWLRGRAHSNQPTGNNDSAYVGLDGNLARIGPNGDREHSQMTAWVYSWDWRSDASSGSDPMILTNVAPGLHTFIVYLREDGTLMDKILLEPGARSNAGNSTEPGPATSNGGLGDTESWDYLAQPPAAPTISIVAPIANQAFAGGGAIGLEASVTGPTQIQSVQFLNGTNVLGTVTAAPYNISWQNVPEGIYNVTARVTDVIGYSVTSAGVRIVVDSTKPVAYAVGSKGNASIGVYFRDLSGMNAASATNIANYVVNNGSATVTNATLEPDGRAVLLALSAPVSGQFTITITNISDLGFGPNVLDATTLSSSTFTSFSTRDVGVISTTDTNLFTDPAMPGLSQAISTDGYYVRAGGHDIWDAAEGFHFVYMPMTGDFDIATRVEAISQADAWSKAGLMVREDLDGNSRNMYIGATPTGGQNLITAQWRPAKGAASLGVADASRPRPSPLPNAWLRITRTNESYVLAWGTNGVNWSTLLSTNMSTAAYPATVYVGLATTSHNNGTNVSNMTAAYYRDIKGFAAPVPENVQLNVRLSPSGDAVIVTWTSSNSSAKLQSSGTPMSDAWADVTITPTVSGNNYSVTIPTTGQAQFFQLRR